MSEGMRGGAAETALVPEPSDRTDGPGRGSVTSEQLALGVFVAALVVAMPVLLYLGRNRWFLYDEWAFLAARDLSPRGVFAAHASHWVTLPVVVYRIMWRLFGLNSYWPYQVLSVVSHLAVVALIRVIMRRVGVRPWTATAVASLLILFGPGDDNIVGAFQITFTAAVAFGLVHLILADHDGTFGRRDLLGLVAGLAGLMCSGVAVSMVIIVGVAVLVRRGWKLALVHTLPLGAVYALWFLAIGDEGYSSQNEASVGAVLGFIRTAVAASFGSLTQVPGLGWALGALVVVGCFLAWRGLPLGQLRRVAAAPVALLVGALAFLVITGVGRVGGYEIARASRFIYIVAVLVAPAIAIGADAVMLRWRVAAPVLAVALLVAIVANIRVFSDEGRRRAAAFQHEYTEAFLSWPRLPIARKLPRNVHPDRVFAPWVTLGWLEDGVASGRIPAPDRIGAVGAATSTLQLALTRPRGHAGAVCVPLPSTGRVRLPRGASLELASAITVVYTDDAGTRSIPLPFSPVPDYTSLVAAAGPLDIEVQVAPGGAPPEVCDAGGAAPTGS